MFNKKTLMSALATIVVAGGAILFMNAGGKQDSLFAENVEALAQDEGAIITCGEGRCGRCFEEKNSGHFINVIGLAPNRITVIVIKSDGFKKHACSHGYCCRGRCLLRSA